MVIATNRLTVGQEVPLIPRHGSKVHVANSTWKQQTAPQAVRRSNVTP